MKHANQLDPTNYLTHAIWKEICQYLPDIYKKEAIVSVHDSERLNIFNVNSKSISFSLDRDLTFRILIDHKTVDIDPVIYFFAFNENNDEYFEYLYPELMARDLSTDFYNIKISERYSFKSWYLTHKIMREIKYICDMNDEDVKGRIIYDGGGDRAILSVGKYSLKLTNIDEPLIEEARMQPAGDRQDTLLRLARTLAPSRYNLTDNINIVLYQHRQPLHEEILDYEEYKYSIASYLIDLIKNA